jgi:hypothetical protein
MNGMPSSAAQIIITSLPLLHWLARLVSTRCNITQVPMQEREFAIAWTHTPRHALSQPRQLAARRFFCARAQHSVM